MTQCPPKSCVRNSKPRYITKNTKSKTLILTLNQKPETRWVRMFHVWKDILKGVRKSPSHKWRKKVCDWPSLLLFLLFKKILCAHSNQFASFLNRRVVENTSRCHKPFADIVSRFTTFWYTRLVKTQINQTISYLFSDTQTRSSELISMIHTSPVLHSVML